jgi:hypothetical protein
VTVILVAFMRRPLSHLRWLPNWFGEIAGRNPISETITIPCADPASILCTSDRGKSGKDFAGNVVLDSQWSAPKKSKHSEM